MNKTFVKGILKYFIDSGEVEIKTGPFGTQLHASDYVEKGTPVINVRNIGYGRIKTEKLEYINEETVQRLSSHLLKYNDIVFGRKGAVDRHALIGSYQQGWFQGSDCLRIRIKSGSIDSHFLSYYFLTENHKKWMLAQCSHGATMASLNQDIISRISLNLPNIQIQQKIASILSSYDDLIENNTRRIEILEQMAKLIYEEWFVKFRFSGHENEKIIDGVPEGWEITNTFKIMDVLSGGTPKTSVPEFWDGDIPFFTPKDSTDIPYVLETGKNISEQGLSKCNSHLYPKDTIFITARGTVGKLNLAQVPMAMNQSCYALVGREPLTQYFLYCALHSAIDQFKSRAVGAVFDAIVVDTFKVIPFVVPNRNLIDDFTEIVTPIFKQIDNLHIKNQNLRKTRDLLLPKLISGEIDVSDLDIRIRNEYKEP